MGTRKVGRRGLSLKEVRRLEKLIAGGQDRQTILEQSGVTLKTLRKAQQQALPAQRQTEAYGRCEACGVWVKLPCVVCRVRRMQRLWSLAKQLRAKRKRKNK